MHIYRYGLWERGSHPFRSLSNPHQWAQVLTIAIEFICQLITQLITRQLWLTASPLLFLSPCITITSAEPFAISQARAAPNGSSASYTQGLLILDLPEFFLFFQNLPGPLFLTECNLAVCFALLFVIVEIFYCILHISQISLIIWNLVYVADNLDPFMGVGVGKTGQSLI